MDFAAVPERFREARECAGFTPAEAAEQMGLSPACLYDIESYDDDLVSCYSLSEIRQFCAVLGIHPRQLFGFEGSTPLTVSDLATAIREHCRSREITIKEFEDKAGWAVAESLDTPDTFLSKGYSIEGLAEICQELSVDWRRLL